MSNRHSPPPRVITNSDIEEANDADMADPDDDEDIDDDLSRFCSSTDSLISLLITNSFLSCSVSKLRILFVLLTLLQLNEINTIL